MNNIYGIHRSYDGFPRIESTKINDVCKNHSNIIYNIYNSNIDIVNIEILATSQ